MGAAGLSRFIPATSTNCSPSQDDWRREHHEHVTFDKSRVTSQLDKIAIPVMGTSTSARHIGFIVASIKSNGWLDPTYFLRANMKRRMSSARFLKTSGSLNKFTSSIPSGWARHDRHPAAACNR
jgi:hypothetical protein